MLEIQELKDVGDPIALQLESMLAYQSRHEPTESPFSASEILAACDQQSSSLLANDLHELASALRWDAASRHYFLGDYRIGKCLSVNSMGATYHSHDLKLDRDVVLLLAYPRITADSTSKIRIVESSRAVARLFHTNVAAILGVVETEQITMVLRQWVPGESLTLWHRTRRSSSVDAVTVIGCGIANGLDAIHREQVLHGDLKPANIILRKGQLDPVIIDFGTATWITPNQESIWMGGTHHRIPFGIAGIKHSLLVSQNR